MFAHTQFAFFYRQTDGRTYETYIHSGVPNGPRSLQTYGVNSRVNPKAHLTT